MNYALDQVFWGNTIRTWMIAAGIILIALTAIYIVKRILIGRLKRLSSKTATHFDDFLVKLIERLAVPLFYFLAIYGGISFLTLHHKVQNVLHVVILLISTFFILRVITAVIAYAINSYVDKQPDQDLKRRQARGILLIVNLIVWLLGIIFLIDNLGYDITTVVAGLGIGGIAIALAAQAILGDLFSYFVIFFDKPFEIGDFVSVGDKKGTIEQVGIKTTRIRALTGEQLVCSNTDLTSSRLHNFKRLNERRVALTLTVTYQTKAAQLKKIPQMVKDIIEEQSDTRFDRGHFSGFGESSLNFEFVYFVLSSEYNIYMDHQQDINFRIVEAFEKEKIDFAYPTRTLFINNEEKEDALPVSLH